MPHPMNSSDEEEVEDDQSHDVTTGTGGDITGGDITDEQEEERGDVDEDSNADLATADTNEPPEDLDEDLEDEEEDLDDDEEEEEEDDRSAMKEDDPSDTKPMEVAAELESPDKPPAAVATGTPTSVTTTTATAPATAPTTEKKKRKMPAGLGGSRKGRAPAVRGLTIPFRTVKKAMKLDPDIPIVQNEAAIMTTLASELFLKALATEAIANAKARGRNTIRYEDVAEARTKHPALSFLETLLP